MPIPKFPELEEQILKDWKQKDIFKKTLAKPSPKGEFVFYDGPPTANGIPHIGHVETRAFKDIIPRFKTMQGFHVERKAGWDTQGLPVELEVEKDLGISGKKDIEKFGIAEFNAKAKGSVWKYKDLWEKMTARVGFWLDTDKPYITYQPEYIESLWWIFKQIWDQKLLEQDYKVVPYCPRCGTALSSHEVAQGYQEVTETSVYVKFKLDSKQKIGNVVTDDNTYILAWTTTPWTLPGNVALAVGKEIEYIYARLETSLERDLKDGGKLFLSPGNYIFAKEALSRLTEEGNYFTDLERVPVIKGSDLLNIKYQRLFDIGQEYFDKAYYITDARFVTTKDGTGVVHTAVMYGEDDYNLGQEKHLPKRHTVDETGRYYNFVEPFGGLEVRDAKGETQKKIISWLRERGNIFAEVPYKHDYPFCWRCKHPLLYYAKTSWFIMMSKLREELIANNEKIHWYPSHIKEGRFGEWLCEVKDWAISRERYWGTPIPIWQCDNPDCKHQECLGSYQDLLEKLPTRNKYIFVRHGESTINVEKVLNTLPENKDRAPLTTVGAQQAADAVKALSDKKIDQIFASQFIRAQQTANIFAQALGLSVTEDKRINEFLIGEKFEGKSYDEYHASFPVTNKSLRFHQASPGGETWLDVRNRMFSFLHELDAANEGKTFLIVTHADPILVAQWALGLTSESTIPHDYPKNCEPLELKFPAGLFQPDGSFDPHRPFIDGISWKCTECSTGTMKRIPEVADAWFDSGAMPFAQYHYPFENTDKIDSGSAYPAEYISEAIDQTRGWFYTLLAISTILQKAKVVKEASYKNVIVLGHINDAKGKKLSKSSKNYVDPMTLIDQHGADALRWFMYVSNQPWEPKNFDPKTVDEGVKKTFLILMNVVSFWQLATPTPPLPSNGGDMKPAHPLDRWVYSMVNQLTKDVTERLEKYDVTGAARAIAAFVTELSTWYVRRSRDRFKGDQAPIAAAMLQHVLLKVSKLMAPFTPFLAEHVYCLVGGDKESVHLEDWSQVGEIDERLISDMRTARTIVEQGHALRAKAGAKVRQPLQQVVTTEQLRPDLDDIVRDELNVKELHWADKLPTGSDWAIGEKVALDITITDELKEEGMFRDIVREFNALRKTAGLKPSDEITAHVEPNTTAAKIIERFAQEFLQQVRAKAVTPNMEGAENEADLELDGAIGQIGLTKS